jgi:hypothetical protein
MDQFTPQALGDLAGGDVIIVPNFVEFDNAVYESLKTEIDGSDIVQSDVGHDGSRPVHRCPQDPQPWAGPDKPSAWTPTIYALKNLVEVEAGHGFNWASVCLEDGPSIDEDKKEFVSEILLDQRPGSYIAILFFGDSVEAADPSSYGPSPTSVAYSASGIDTSTELKEASEDTLGISRQYLTFAPKRFAEVDFRDKGPQTVCVCHNTLILIGPKTALSFMHKIFIDEHKFFGQGITFSPRTRIVLRATTTICAPLSRDSDSVLRLGLYGPSVQGCTTKKAMHRFGRWQELTQLMVLPSAAALATLGTVAIASLSTRLGALAGEVLLRLGRDSTHVTVGAVATIRTMLATLIAGFTTSSVSAHNGQSLSRTRDRVSEQHPTRARAESEDEQRFGLLFNLFQLHPLDGPSALNLLEHGTVTELALLSADGTANGNSADPDTTATEHLATVLQRCADRARQSLTWMFSSRSPSSANTAAW